MRKFSDLGLIKFFWQQCRDRPVPQSDNNQEILWMICHSICFQNTFPIMFSIKGEQVSKDVLLTRDIYWLDQWMREMLAVFCRKSLWNIFATPHPCPCRLWYQNQGAAGPPPVSGPTNGKAMEGEPTNERRARYISANTLEQMLKSFLDHIIQLSIWKTKRWKDCFDEDPDSLNNCVFPLSDQ